MPCLPFSDDLRHISLDIEFLAEAMPAKGSGQTCGMSEDEKIRITLSPGRYIKGESFKLGY
jgi:hypothetical protein